MIDITKAHVVHDWTYDRPLLAARFDPQSRFVVTSAENNLLQRFKLPGGEVEVFPAAHDSWIQALEIAPEGNFCVSGGGDGRLVWWNLAGETVAQIRIVEDAHKGWIRGLAISPDGRFVVSGGYDKLVHLWDAASGERLRTWSDHEMNVYSACFFPDNQRIATGDLQGKIILRDRDSDASVATFDGATLHSFNDGQKVNFGGVRCLSVTPDMKTLAAGGLHKSTNPLGAVHEPLALQFNVEDQKLLHSHTAEGIPGGGLWHMAYLPDGHLMGISGGSTGGFLLFWKLGQDATVHKFQLPSLARDMGVSSDGRLVVTSHYDRHTRVTLLAAE